MACFYRRDKEDLEIREREGEICCTCSSKLGRVTDFLWGRRGAERAINQRNRPENNCCPKAWLAVADAAATAAH